METGSDIMTGGIEYFSVLFWTQPHTWNIPNEEEYESPETGEDEEW